MDSLFVILMAIGCTSPPTGPHSADENLTTEITDPGQVSDLVVTDSTGTTVTLSFTQVDDGAGNPADYAVRFHIGPMNWGAAEEVTEGTCAAPLQGTAVGSAISCTIEVLTPDIAYTFQVAAFRGTFQVDADYGPLSNVVPDMDPQENPLEHEPANFKTILDETWSLTNPAGWILSGTESNASIVSQLGSNNVLQVSYPNGFEGGRAPVSLSYNWKNNQGITSDDVAISMRWSANKDWQNHESNVNKLAFIHLDDSESSHFVIVLYGNHIRIAPEKSGGWSWLSPTTAAQPTLGAWNDLEFRFTKTSYNRWHITWWINGKLYGDHYGINMADDDGSIRSLSLSPTWGGTGDVKTQTDYFWWDRVRVSAGDI